MDGSNRIESMFGLGCMIECIDEETAQQTAQAVIDASGIGDGGTPTMAFFAGGARLYLARYLLAAAILGEGADTIVEWVRMGDRRPWDALTTRPDVVPGGWATTRELIEAMPPDHKDVVFSLLSMALSPARS